MDFLKLANGPISLNVAVAGEGPLILCVHGFPELWYSWRHQIAYFSARGFRVAAMDVRGYGGSTKPGEIAAYSMRALTSDIAAVVDQLGNGRAILFGHDWGAPLVWNTALLYPEKISAVAGLSVPYIPRGDASFLSIARVAYADRFFYQLYFQDEGVAERELEADIGTALRKIYFAASGDAPLNEFLKHKPTSSGLLEGMVDPQPFPAWLSGADLRVFIDAFRAGGMRGPINRYRAQTIDFDEMAAFATAPVTQPSFFLGGEKDLVRALIPGVDLYASVATACTDFRGAVFLPRIGHWVQQEAPDASNEALEGFLKAL